VRFLIEEKNSCRILEESDEYSPEVEKKN